MYRFPPLKVFLYDHSTSWTVSLSHPDFFEFGI